MATSELKIRPELTPRQAEAIRRAVEYAIDRWQDFRATFAARKREFGAAEFDSLLAAIKTAQEAKRLLVWRDCDNGRYWEASIGNPDDHVTFTVQHRPTCYRRGPWLLQIKVCEGRHHTDWGCFDDADKPERDYHDLSNLIAEAEAIAAVLLADRMERGPIEGWVPAHG